MTWAKKAETYSKAGFSEEEIRQEEVKQRQKYQAAGFSNQEVDKYFGTFQPDMTPVKKMIEDNLKKSSENAQLQEGQEPEEADSIWDAFEAGFEMSSSNMLYDAYKGRSVAPKVILPENAPTFYRIASQLSTIAGDLPAMVAGGIAGGLTASAASQAVPVLGQAATPLVAAVGVGGGANALPEALRSTLMEYYEKGEIQDFGDFWERTSAVFIDTAKSYVVGGASFGVGGKVLKMTGKSLGTTGSRLATAGAEVTTAVTIGSALEGQVPKAQDFLDAGILIAGLHGSARTYKAINSKFRKIYSKTGVRPEDVVQEANLDPSLKKELLSKSEAIPSKFREMAETPDISARGQVEAGMRASKKEAAPAPKKDAAPLDPPTQKILNRVETRPEKTKNPYTKDDLYTDYVDRLNPIKKFVEEIGESPTKIEAFKNPYKLARMANDSKAKVQHFFEKGALDYKTLETTGKAFNEIIDPFKSDLRNLKAYEISRRAIDLEARGIKTGMDIAAAKEVVASGKKTYESAHKDLVEFRQSFLKYAKDSGLLAEQDFKNIIAKGAHYVPFKRILEDGTVKGGTSKGKITKKIKGSESKIQDPFQSLVENADIVLAMAEKNRAVSSLVNLAEKNGVPFEKVKAPMKPTRISSKEMQKFFKDQGLDAKEASALMVFRPQDRPLGKNEFEVYRNGKREVYKTDPELAQTLKDLDGSPAAQNMMLKMARGFTTVKRLGITLTPDFIIRNFMRDQVTGFVFSKANLRPVSDALFAVGDILKKNDNYYNWLKAGGANGAFIDLTKKYQNIYALSEKTGLMRSAHNVVLKGKDFLELASTIAEQSTRLAEFKRVTKGAAKGDKLFDGGFASREITLDFQRMGRKIQAWNAVTAFLNAQIQGLDKTARVFKEKPLKATSTALASVTAPSAMLWWINKDDQRVQDLPAWQKDLFWIIATDDWQEVGPDGVAPGVPDYLVRENEGRLYVNEGTLYRIPKPFEIGILFGSLPERALDAFYKEDPDAFYDLGNTLFDAVVPNAVPDIIAPAVEQFFNKSFFTGSDLVPMNLERRLPQYQYNVYTSETAKQLSKFIGSVPGLGDLGPESTPLSSPIIVENYIQSWGGSMGRYALQFSDQLLAGAGVKPEYEKPTDTLADIPFIKSFIVRNPSSSTKNIQKFYDKFRENERFLNTIKALPKEGALTEAEKLMQDPRNKRFMINLSGIQDAMSNQSSMIRNIYRDPEMSADEKRQLIDGLYYGINETAKHGLQMVKEWEESLEEQGFEE